MSEGVLIGDGEGGGEEFRETLGHVHCAAGVIRGHSVENALGASVPEGIGTFYRGAEWLIRDDEILVCPEVVGEHDRQGVEGCTFTAIRKVPVAHGLVKVGKRIHGLDGGTQFRSAIGSEARFSFVSDD